MEWLIILVMLIIIWLLMIWPSDYIKDDKKKLRKYLYAHRGLHNNEKSIPENSLAAFDAACEAGYGMELDVQFSKDMQIVVFHDDDLKRMCGVDKKVFELTYEELSELSLAGTEHKIPLFTDVLKLVEGRTPIVVELKNCKIYEKLVIETNKILRNYKGDYCVESFNPLIVRKYAKTNPMVLRGLLMTNHVKAKSINVVLGFMIQEMLLNFMARPQFIACDHKSLNIWGVNVVKFIFRPVMAAWTVRNEEEFEKVKNFDIVIFEDFLPDPSRPELVHNK
jgi:glycerophosphoryl diester phosphodiesterase